MFWSPKCHRRHGSPTDRNPVAGVEQHVRMNVPHGLEYRVSKIASGTTRTSGAISLANAKDSHALPTAQVVDDMTDTLSYKS